MTLINTTSITLTSGAALTALFGYHASFDPEPLLQIANAISCAGAAVVTLAAGHAAFAERKAPWPLETWLEQHKARVRASREADKAARKSDLDGRQYHDGK